MGGEKDQKAKNIQIGSIESNSSKISEIDMLMNKLREEIKERTEEIKERTEEIKERTEEIKERREEIKERQKKLARLAKLKEKIINEEKTKQKK